MSAAGQGATEGAMGGFLRDLLIRSGSDLLNVFVNLVIITLVARQLVAQDYGIYTQVMTTASLLVPILLLRLNAAAVRFFPGESAGDLRDRFMTMGLVVALIAAATAALLAVFAGATDRLVFAGQAPARVPAALAAFLLLRCAVTFGIDYFRAINQSSRASYYNSLRFCLTLAAVAWQLQGDPDVLAVLCAHLLAELLVLAVLSLHLWRLGVIGLRFHWSPGRLAPYLRYALPLVPYTFFIALNQFADRYFIAHLLDLESAGVYSFTYNMVAAAFLINTSLAYVIYPHLSRLWHDGAYGELSRYLSLGLQLFLVFALPIACGVYFIYSPVAALLVGQGFAVEPVVVALIAAGYLAYGLGSLLGYLIDLSARTTLFIRILVVTAGLNCLLNALLIPQLGLAGAALATFATYALQCYLTWRLARRLTPVRVTLQGRFLAVCLAGCAVMYLLLQWLAPVVSIGEVLTAIAAGALSYFLVTGRLVWRQWLALRQGPD